jgi:hypothetical protein
VLLTPILLSPILVTPIRLLLTDLLVLILLGRRTKTWFMASSVVSCGACTGGTCSAAACSGAVKTSISASLWRPLNEVPYKKNMSKIE